MIPPHNRPSILRTSRKKSEPPGGFNAAESLFERTRNSKALAAKSYPVYLFSSLQKTQVYRLWRRYLELFRRFRLVAILFRIYSDLLVLLQFGTAFFFLAVAILLLVPLLAVGSCFVVFSALLLYRRENERMKQALKDKRVTVYFPTLGGELSEGILWRAHVDELSTCPNAAILVVSPHFWSGQGVYDDRFYLLLRREKDNLYLLRKHYFFSLKRAVLDKKSSDITFVY